jgi:hypothetical protein
VLLFLVLVVVECEFNILYQSKKCWILKLNQTYILIFNLIYLHNNNPPFISIHGYFMFLYLRYTHFHFLHSNLVCITFWRSLTSCMFSKNPFGRRKDSAGGLASVLNGAPANWLQPEGDVSWTLACHHGFHTTTSYLWSAYFCWKRSLSCDIIIFIWWSIWDMIIIYHHLY